MPPPAWQQHHHVGSAAIDPDLKQREGLTIQGMGWIGDRDLTTDLIQ